MSSKFIRQYLLEFLTPQGDRMVITDPFTVEFNITRQNLASLNTATFTIYNLGPKSRARIYKDLYDTNTVLPISFSAGYKYGSSEKVTFLAECFKGQIKQAYSVREGVNFKTVIEAWDGGNVAANGFISETVKPKTSLKDVIVSLVNSMTNIEGSVVSDKFTQQNNRGFVLFGNPLDLAQQLTQNQFYIDNQTAYALQKNEALLGYINTIDDRLGILGTPKRTGTNLEVQMIFEPRLIPSQSVELNSTQEKIFNGKYKLTGITHQGIISQQVNGDCTTTVILNSATINTIIKTNIQKLFRNPDNDA